MFKNYLITAWRNIVKNGVFSIINIAGLALGLMSCILIMLFVRQESGFDTWLTDSDRLVRMHTGYTMPNQPAFDTVRSAGRMMEAIRDYAANEVETGVRFVRFGTTVQQDGEAFSETATMVDGSFFDVFDLPFVHGSRDVSFSKPMDMVITEETAIKYFGRTNVVGETLTICCVQDQIATMPIAGVIKDLPDATHLDLDMLVYLNPALFENDTNVLHTWTSLNVYTYFKMKPGVTAAQLQERANYWMNNESPLVNMVRNFLGDKAENMPVTDFVKQRIMPVTDLHLHAKEQAGNMGDMTPMGDSKMINTFTVVAALVLLIACINFMNLSTAKASKRAREVAMRKVLGASRKQVAIQFLGEAVTLVLIALIFALVAVELVLPIYNDVLSTNLQLRLLDNPQDLLGLIGLAILVGIGAGLYPALYLSRFLPGQILKASKSTESGNSAKLRSALVVFQFSTSIVLVISTLVVYGQTIYSNAMDVGYRSDNKLVLNIRQAGENLDSLKQELLNIPAITDVTYSSEAPTQDNENNTQFKLLESLDNQSANEPLIMNYHNMGYGFFEAYNVEPVAGRLFSEAYGTDTIVPGSADDEEVGQASAIINMTAMRKFGFTSAEQAIGKTLETPNEGTQHLTIVGVVPDLYFRSIKFGIRASVYMLNPRQMGVASLTFTGNDVTPLMTEVERVWKNNVPMQPIDLQFLSEMMEAQYADEETTAQLFLVFSMLAIIIACLGLYGLSAFTVERKTKEIGIRKVMGAKVRDILKLLIWQFSKPVMLANFIAWPVACYFMLSWLSAFPYRIETTWLVPICLGVGLLSLLIAWTTVAGIAAKVAHKSPVHALRYE